MKGVCLVKSRNLSGFTLVELIVVITILAILGTFGFMTFSKYQKDARDGKRITNVSTIAQGFDINMAAGKLINTSETSTGYNIVITGSTFTMTGYYGVVNNELLDSLKVYSKDITTTTDYPYSYSYFPTERKYQVSSFLENSSNLPTAMHFIDRVYAETNTGYVFVKGNFTATGEINSLIPSTAAWTNASGIPKVIAGSDTVVPGTSTSTPPAPVVCASGYTEIGGICVFMVDATCGTANKAYVYTDTTFGTDTFCTASNSTLSGGISPTFPAGGSVVSWACNSTTGGNNVSCSAGRGIIATGGTTVMDISGTTYRVHEFKTVGSTSFIVNMAPTGATVEYLIIGGGGGGSYGGGGGGGYKTGVGFAVSIGSYPVIVGESGIGGWNNVTSGGSSTFSTITSSGGGYGGNSPGTNGGPGGSGGGAGFNGGTAGLSTSGQGYNGGGTTSTSAGGGGGAGGAGLSGTSGTYNVGGNGGIGISSSISGISITYAGGGGGYGGSGFPNGIGSPSTTATANTGRGGVCNGYGGSGIVIIRYRIN